ncbi:MAG TPA: hypothetical protein VKI17_11405 [Gemmataceae bacterium]|nr:hypothetical protein [Gemmataceae bacterium]
MRYHEEEKLDALLPYGTLLTAGKFNEEPATADIPLAGNRRLPNSKGQRSCTDYSEEAIPERDPAYQLPDGTLYETQTVEVMPAAARLALARCLEQLGMSASRAAMVASL